MSKLKYELEIVERFYKIVDWYTKRILRMPRAQRIILGQPLQHRLMESQNLIIRAGYEPNNEGLLTEFNVQLDQIRCMTRLLFDNCLFTERQVLYIGGELNVIGGMAGNWLKRIRQKLR